MATWNKWFATNMAALWCLLLTGCCQDTYSILTFRTEQGYVFDIRGECFVEISQAVLCRVTKDDEILVEKGIGVTLKLRELEFALIEEKEVFALVETANPQHVIALFDQSIRQYWTCMTGPEYRTTGKALLQRLNHSNPAKPFVLCDNHTLQHKPISTQ